MWLLAALPLSARLCQNGGDWVQSATTMHILSLHVPHSSQLPCSNLEVLSACLSHSAKPTNCGRIDDDGKLAIHWMRSPPAPDAVLELFVCMCVRSCKLTKCTFVANRLACTYMRCKLQSCSNRKQQEDMTLSNSVIQTMISIQMGRSMFDFYVWSLCLNIVTTLHTRPAETRNCRKMTASNSVI